MSKITYNLRDTSADAISMLVVGDCMFTRNVGEIAKEKGIPFFFDNLQWLFDKSDIRFCNFESPITNSIDQSRYSRSNFKTNPQFVQEISNSNPGSTNGK